VRAAGLLVSLVLILASTVLLPGGAAEPTPGLGCVPAAAGAPMPRIVPEAEYALDYISFDEWRVCIDLINKTAPQYVEPKIIGQSVGWNTANGKATWPVYAVEVTNEASAVPFADKIKVAFILSIHGNEKGGREGGFRVIEDLARGIGIAQEYPEVRKQLDYMVAVFVFPNPDGWTHEELAVAAGAPNQAGGFVRENGGRSDLNRQWPNHGWTREAYKSMGQPEMVATINYLKSMYNWAYGTDIHGMLTPTDAKLQEYQKLSGGAVPRPGGSLLMGMLSAGQAEPHEHLKSTRVAELLKERVNADPNLREWSTAPNLGPWGGQVMEWGTSWDTIGYVDSGFTGDFFVQDHGLNAGDMDFEMAYNHLVTDNHYAGPGMELNRLHVRCVRQIVSVFMSAGATEVNISYDTQGTRTAFLFNPKLFTNREASGGTEALTGWAAQNPFDDGFDFAHVDYEASPNEYFTDLQKVVRDGDKPGVLDAINAGDLSAARLAQYDQLVIAGSAIEQVDGPRAQVLKTWVEGGGHLVLTDQALRLLNGFGLVPEDKIVSTPAYAGHTNFVDRESPYLKGLRGLARQTYEAVPIGYEPGRAPIWAVDDAAWKAAGGKTVGGVAIARSQPPVANNPLSALQAANPAPLTPNVGDVAIGKGSVRIIGALLPDPSKEFYHPYGLDGYATTYTGNLLLRNMLGWEESYAAPPVVVEELGKSRTGEGAKGQPLAETGEPGSTPALGLVGLLVCVASAVLWARRRA
jgi:hypothetical protein